MVQGQSHCASNILSNSHHFHSKWVDPPNPERQQFQNLTLKIQGQVHGWGHNLKSQCESNILSTHIPFVPKYKAKVMVEVKGEINKVVVTSYRLTSLLFHVNRPSHSWDEIIFQNLTLKIQGQGHGWGERWNSQHGSNILSTHAPFIPCQSAFPFLRYDFFKTWPWKSKVKVMVGVKVESHKVGVTSYRLTSLCSMLIGPPIPVIQHFQNLTLKI